MSQDPEKQKDVGELLGVEVDSDEFFKLVTIGKLITDFKAPDEAQVGLLSGFATGCAGRFRGSGEQFLRLPACHGQKQLHES